VTERFFSSHAELEHALHDLAAFIEYPPEPALAPAVRQLIEQEPVKVRQKASPWSGLLGAFRQPAFTAVAALVAVCVVFIAWPAGRIAVAHWLGLEDIRITYEEPPEGVGNELSLGEQTTLFEAQGRVDFDILVPEGLGAPDSVYFSPVAGGMVNLVYAASDDLPAAPGTDVGVIVTQFRSRLDEQFFFKYVPHSANVEEVAVRAEQGYWIDEPHQLTYVDPGGEFGQVANRLSAPSLVWEETGVVFRIESALSRDDAVALAESLR
jgi:hypothetical protein